MQTGSDEHHAACCIARFTMYSKVPCEACLTRPPIDPSESPDAVYISTPHMGSSSSSGLQYSLSRKDAHGRIDERLVAHGRLAILALGRRRIDDLLFLRFPSAQRH